MFSGEIDLTNIALFSHHLRDLIGLEARPVIDLRQVSYMDSTGVRALELTASGKSDIILILPAVLRRLAEITNLDLIYEIEYDGSPR